MSFVEVNFKERFVSLEPLPPVAAAIFPTDEVASASGGETASNTSRSG